MGQTLPELEKRLWSLEQEFHALRDEHQHVVSDFLMLRNNVDTYLWNQIRAVYSERTLEDAVLNVIIKTYELDLHVLAGHGEERKAGRRPSYQIRQEQKLDEARLWLICLLRQISGPYYQPLKTNFPWLTTVRYAEAGRILEDMAMNFNHLDKPHWRKLLQHVKDEAVSLGVNDTSRVDDELKYA